MGGVIISVCSHQGGVGGLVFGKVGVTDCIASQPGGHDLCSFFFSHQHNVTDIPSLKSVSHDSSPE